MKVYAFSLDKDGLVNGDRKMMVDFGKENGCDGMRIDTQGNLYLAVRSLARPGVMVIDPEGKELAFLPTGEPNQKGDRVEGWQGIASNVEVGVGDESNTLYGTIGKSSY